MKKSITLVATTAMAFSMFASVAMADTAKTSADYTDLAGIESGLKTKIDTLLSKGIFEGVSSDTFGISQNMTRAQFAKVASLVFGLKVDTSLQTSSFTDVQANDPANGWAIPYIEAAKKAGLIDGMTETTFAPGDNVTVGQLDTVLLKGLGKKVDTSATPWYANAVKQATELGIHPSNKNGDAAATRADLVVGAYGSLPASPTTEQPANENKVSVASVRAQGDVTIVVALDKIVDTAKASFTVSKDGTLLPVTTNWEVDKKTATLTLSTDNKLTSGSYVVTLGGIDSSTIGTASATLTVGSVSSSTGDYKYWVPESYTLSNVIDSGLTESATGESGYATRAEAEDPTQSMFAKEIEITVTTTSGDEVAAPGLIESVTSSNPTIVKAAVSADHKGYILGNKAGTATINILYKTISGEKKQLSVPVTVKDETISTQKVEARDTTIKATVSTVTSGVYGGVFNAYEEMDMLVTDNYGNEYEREEIQDYNFALGIQFMAEDVVGDPSKGDTGSVMIDNAGYVFIKGNVTQFTLTVVTTNGTRVAAGVQVTQE
ncbi:S-layer homology domain-containing protein [Paenibacillus sp. NPDC056579]|uniref:S-layer homology domain-containing protein n=1 Tax=Paenibacillus sp. NPDC056579 TaxID=3345871 RepID=UPI0036A00853